MGLTRVSITRPLFILMVITAMVILGGVSYTFINAELFPSINVPIVTVSTNYSGASPDDVDRLITQPIQDAVAGIANVDIISSSSSEGRSQVTITFTDAANIDTASTDVQRRVGSIAALLPADADAPSVLKIDPGQQAVMSIALTGDMPLDQLFQMAKDQIKPPLEAGDGVASVTINGGREREIQIQVDPNRLRAYGLTIDQVSQALARENQGLPSGSIDRGRQRYNLRVYGLFQSVDDLSNLTVSGSTGTAIRLQDVASIVDTVKRPTSRTFLNGREAVSLSITKQSGSNEIVAVDGIRAELAQLRLELPAGTELSVISDTSIATRNSLDGVTRSLFEAVALTGIVLLLFLHTMRSALIVLFAIPTSLISTFIVMNFMGFTLNIMTSMALVLVIGVLVDDSIVVLENVFRHLELGETPFAAAIKGRSEIGIAAIAITLVDVVVFTPVAFMSGTVGAFFQQFGLVIVAATLLSLFISFTLTPMLASRWLKSGHQGAGGGLWGLFIKGFEWAFGKLQAGYVRTLGLALQVRWLPLLVAITSLVLAVAMIPAGLIKFEFIPTSDNGQFTVTAELPPGSSLEATEAILRAIEARLETIPEIHYALTNSGVGGTGSSGGGVRFGRIQVVLVGVKERQRSQATIIQEVTQLTGDLPARVLVGTGAQPLQVNVTGPDPETLQTVAGEVEATLQEIPGARDVSSTISQGNPETRIVPSRRRMADVGVTAQQVAQVLRTAVDGTIATKLRAEGEDEIDVRLISNPATRSDLDSIGSIPLTAVRGGESTTLTLDQVTQIESVAGPTSIDRRNRQRLATVNANLVGTTPLNDVTQPLQAALTKFRADGRLPAGYKIELGGQSEQQSSAFGALFLALGLSIVLEYMLLVALYESMILPLATMFALPLAIIGAFVGLAVSGNTLNLLSLIGVVVLMGLVGKNGILLVDYTNTLRKEGMSRREALMEAGSTRLRPIVMTTMAMVAGMTPLALGLEEGSEIYKGMASVIIGGMISSTILSLLVVPCMYTYFDDMQALIGRIWRWRPVRRRQHEVAVPA